MASILVVDDEFFIRDVLRQFLERIGHEVREAPNGKMALKLQTEKEIDLLITDIIMPDKEGLETIREFREKYPRIKIIAISGGGRIGPQEYLHLAEMMGAHRVFRKPLNLDALREAVIELLPTPS